MTVREALLFRRSDSDSIHLCSRQDTLESILETLKRAPVRRFIVMKEGREMEGVLTIEDILRFLVPMDS